MLKNDLVIQVIVVGYIATNCYVVYRKGRTECFIVDPGDNPDKILDFLEKEHLEVKGILLTHGHFDHILAVESIRKETKAEVYACEAERELLNDSSLSNPVGHSLDALLVAEHYCKDSQKFIMAGMEVQVIHTPGHTGGSTCYYLEKDGILFSGDTLFFESVGRTDFPTGSQTMIIRSIKDKLFILPDDVKVFPGHGSETSIGHEKDNNPYLGDHGYL